MTATATTTARLNPQQVLADLEAKHLKSDIPLMDIGDTIEVHQRIVEGEKERIQRFQGVLIARSGGGINEMITVRRVVDDIGVERVYPIHSPMIATFKVVRRGDARRAKLYFLRDRVGKKRRLRDRRRGLKHVANEPKG
ncbi:MAG: 50S ribosomal protein L19 [Phycisphaerales bacterium]|nr:50S ribosomal protein L19 [Phycisphaerales bacterium]MCB9840146.1 50S ribosomal protein L19 [Phycisphaeraceae bacterium]